MNQNIRPEFVSGGGGITDIPDVQNLLGTLVPLDRAQIVRLCTHLTGDRDAAEDLAQETLYEAWRNAHKLHDPDGVERWLAAIARNVCLRWRRSNGRESSRRTQLHVAESWSRTESAESEGVDEFDPVDAFDLEGELERHELIDRALALLPPMTRSILVERYLQESSAAEISQRLGLSEGSVAMRLQRGKVCLRRLLTTEFRQEAAAYGLAETTKDQWQETRIWCPMCGQHRLLGRWTKDTSPRRLTLHGAHQCPDGRLFFTQAGVPGMYDGVKGFRAAFGRMLNLSAYYRQYLPGGVGPCVDCRRWSRFHPLPTPNGPDWQNEMTGVYHQCFHCGAWNDTRLHALARALPAARAFYREHPRARTLPERRIEVEALSAVVTRFESVTDQAYLDVVSALETFEVLTIHGRGRAVVDSRSRDFEKNLASRERGCNGG